MGQSVAGTAAVPMLSTPEWRAVRVAFNDAADTACVATREPGRLGRLFAVLTGIEAKKPLADPRLETLRHFVCATRRTRKPASDLVPALINQGFNRAQIDALALLAV